jgi:AsmA protein
MRLTIAAGASVAALLLAAVVTPFLIDVNKFRPILESRATLALGRNVKLGHLGLRLLSGKLIANDIEIEDNPSFSKTPFLSARSVEIGVEMIPLIFSRQIDVTEIIIEHPEITVLKAADGTYNFSTLGESSAKNLNQASSALQAVSVRKLILNRGKLMLGIFDSKSPPLVYDKFGIEVSHFSSTSEFPFKLTTTLPGGGDAILTGNAGPISAQNVASTPFEATIKAAGTNIASYRFIDRASGIAGLASVDESIKSDGKTQTLTGTLRGSAMKFSPGGVPSPSVISIKHNLEVNTQQQLVKITQAELTIGNARFQVTGTIAKPFDERALDCALTASGAPMNDVQTFLRALGVKLPRDSHLQGGSMSTRLSVTGTAASPVVSGPVQVTDTRLVGFNLGAQLGSIAGIAGKAASAPDTSLSSLVFDLKATRSGFQLSNIQAQIPSVGGASGSGTINPDRTLDFKLLAHPSGGMAGALTKMAAAGGGNPDVPITIKGTVETPVFVTDTSAGAHNVAAQAAKGAAAASAHSISKLFRKKKN